jgi:hypothetical protein
MITKRDYIDDCFQGDELDAMEYISAIISKDPSNLPLYVSEVVKGNKMPDSRYWQWMIEQYNSGKIVDWRGSLKDLTE